VTLQVAEVNVAPVLVGVPFSATMMWANEPSDCKPAMTMNANSAGKQGGSGCESVVARLPGTGNLAAGLSTAGQVTV
jgi:hypothetical protein